jgi:hypothetical protein
MTDLEDRLRRDLRELSERARPGSIRPLRVPPVRRRSRAVRWLAPVAAMAAVIGVITGVSLAGHTGGRQPASREGPGRMPPYYLVAQNYFFNQVAKVTVRDSVTGRVLARVVLPFLTPSGARGITGAADGRTFVITDGTALFRLRVAGDGRSARLSRLPITVPTFGNVALSPDGSTIATESQSCRFLTTTKYGCQYSAIQVVSLATGATRTWSTRAPAQQGMWISWDGNANVLFSWASNLARSSQHSGYRLLDVTARGGNLLGARMLPLPPPPPGVPGSSFPESAFITPDGSAVIASTWSWVGSIQRPTGIMKIVELSARTGRLLRVLRAASVTGTAYPLGNVGCQVYGLGPTGVHALVECSSPKTVFGRLDNGRFTRLPGMPNFFVAAAW